MSVRHLIRASASLLLLLGARRSGAQSTTTLLPDATVLPSRAIRIRMLMAWTRADELIGNGPVRNLASPLATDSLGAQQVALFGPIETDIRAALGAPSFRLTAGQLVAVGNSRVLTAPLILEYGLTSKLTLGLVVPLVETRTTLYAQLNPTKTSANVGPNPAFGSNSAAWSQNSQLVSSLRLAADTLQGRLTACQAAPTKPECSTLAGQQTAAQALIQSTSAIATTLEHLYGTSATHPGLAYVPIANNASQEAINARVTTLQKAYETFLTKSLVTGSVAAAAGPAANLQLQRLLADAGHDTLQSIDRASVGDITVGATYQLANSFGDTSAVAAGQRRYRLAVNGAFRIGTGQPGNRNRFFDVGTGYGQPGIEAGVAGDLQLNRRFSASGLANYTLQIGSVDVARVPNAAYSAFPLGVPYTGTFSAGNVLSLTVIPRFRLSGYFGLNGRYSLVRSTGDRYTLGAPIVLDSTSTITAITPTTPYGSAAATAQQIGIGFSYSTVLGPDARPGRIPFEVSFDHLETIAANGGPIAKSFREQIELRVYILR